MQLRWLHTDGWKFVLIFAFIAFILWQVNISLGWVGLILTLWCAYFFRSPVRVTPQKEGLLISPADGKLVQIVDIVPPAELDMGDQNFKRISIFLNVFDVHVNRIPMDGEVEKIIYHPGQFLNASLDKASQLNERNTIVIKLPNGQKIAVVQIAGLIARRIRCDLSVGEKVSAGQLFGLIRFGSRVDVYLPAELTPLVIEGQYMIGGETVLADFFNNELTARQGLAS